MQRRTLKQILVNLWYGNEYYCHVQDGGSSKCKVRRMKAHHLLGTSLI